MAGGSPVCVGGGGGGDPFGKMLKKLATVKLATKLRENLFRQKQCSMFLQL